MLAIKNEKIVCFLRKNKGFEFYIRQVFSDNKNPTINFKKINGRIAIFHTKIDKSVKFSSYFIKMLSMFNIPPFLVNEIRLFIALGSSC